MLKGQFLKVGLLLLLIPLSGCFRYVDCRITLMDAETHMPIQDAAVKVRYTSWPKGPMITPKTVSGQTDQHGQVVLPISTDRNWPSIRAEAAGYFETYAAGDLKREDVEGILEGRAAANAVEVQLHAWARPAPSVLVTLPIDYRGFVRICPPERVLEEAPPHQRVFERSIDEHGRCDLPALPIFIARQEPPPPQPIIHFQLSDGTPVPRPCGVPLEGDSLGAWALWYVDRCNVYIIGTESQAARERRALWPDGVIDSSTYPEFAQRVRRGRFEDATMPR
jgi:hypothetical protein